jgi:hypothetical protein
MALSSMVINDLYVVGVPGPPAEADPPLLVDANAVLARPVTLELLESIRRRDSQVLQGRRGIEHPKFSERDALNIRSKPLDALALKQPL